VGVGGVGSLQNSATTVNNGGTLKGTGDLGAVTVASGGIHAPGNSIGTQTVIGNYTLLNGGILEIEANAAGQSDLVVVQGTVTLTGAVLRVLADPGNYALATSYLIIDNDLADPVVGTFGAITSSLAFLTASVDTAGGDGNDVVLTLTRNGVDFPTIAVTPNQQAVARALATLPGTNPLIVAIIGQSAAGAQQAFDALSGEVHASVAGLLVDQSWFVRDSILSRLVQASYGGGGTSVAALVSGGPTTVAAHASDTPMMGLGMGSGRAAAPPPASGLAFWSQGFGSWGDFSGNGNAASADRTLGGFVSGMDAGLGNGWRAGLAGGYTQTSIDVGARASSASIDSYNLGGYAGGSLGGLALRGGGVWTWHDIDTDRAIVFPGFFQRSEASYDGDTGQVFGEVALPFGVGTSAMETFAGLAYVHVDTGGFTESGGVAALTSAGGDIDTGYSTLGVRAATELLIDGMVAIPHVAAAWQHAFNDVTADAALAFSGTAANFVVSGVPIARDAALIEAGVRVEVARDAMLGVSYQGQLASDVQDHGISGRLDWRF
jgi:outer membrane autotransporter protein